ncbi:protein tipE-like isoform X1 [Amphibalanus amphitrite]|uniref:protein tipE-like isoform X1 n=1 Tax=Amphibalanus amphitrite TaxID=1232801 RepID=UPI001C90EC08|nr:protein tipE-like isoform X1 [Amphibalanus amphitrite]
MGEQAARPVSACEEPLDADQLAEGDGKRSFLDVLREKRDQNADKVMFYATVLFSLVAIGAFFGFLFLVPFVIEPAVTTIQMDFEVDPVTCCVVSFTELAGKDNCSDWSSCREGCTREIYECVKILVAYTDVKDFSCAARPPNHQWLHNEAYLYPNVKGCGYPPSLNCTVFRERFREPNVTFSCHYSRLDATLVITELDPHQVRSDLVVAFVVPFVSLAVSIAFLVYAYHRMKRKEAEAAAADALAQRTQALLDAEEGEEGEDEEGCGGSAHEPPGRSHPGSNYSLKSITSKINSTVVRLKQGRDCRSGSGSGDEIEMEEVGGEARPPSRYLQPGRLPSGGARRHLLPPIALEPPAGAAPEPAPAPAASSTATTSANSTISPVET